jgi:hypothetical protein
MIFKTVSGSGTIVSRSAELHKESISKGTAAASAQVSKFCFHRAIQGIKLSHHVFPNPKIKLTITAFHLYFGTFHWEGQSKQGMNVTLDSAPC